MSTVDSFTFLSAQTLGRDLALILNKKNSDARKLNNYTRIGLGVTAVLALLLIWLMPSVVELWYNLGSLFLPALLLPVIGGLYERIRLGGPQTLLAMAGAFLISAAAYGYFIATGKYVLGLQPFVPGLVFSLGYYVVMIFLNNKRRRSVFH